jgi:hypothetical protein
VLLAIVVLGFIRWVKQPTPYKAFQTKVAVSRSAAGQFTIYILTCPGESVERVSLTLEDSQRTKDVATLWEIRSSAHTATSQFTVGESPPGFHEVAHSAVPLKPDDWLSAQVDVSDGEFLNEFHQGDAWRGSVYVDEGSYLGSWPFSGVHTSLARFRSVRSLVCEHQHDPPGD